MEERHIEEIGKTDALLQANLDIGQIAIQTDGDKRMMYRDFGGAIHVLYDNIGTSSFTSIKVTTLDIGHVVYTGNDYSLATDSGVFYYDQASNRLGVGTNDPDAVLELVGTSEQLRLSNVHGSDYMTFTVNSSSYLRINTPGEITRVGIDKDPTYTFDVKGHIHTEDNLKCEGYVDAGAGVNTQYVNAKDGNGLFLRDDGSNLGIFVEDATGNVGIKHSSPLAPFHIKTSDREVAIIESTDDGVSVGPYLDLWRNSASPADNDWIGGVRFQGENSNGTKITMAEIRVRMTDVTVDQENANMYFYLRNELNDTLVMQLDDDGGVHMPDLKSGTTQGSAVAGELWHDTTDDTIKMGV